MAELSKKYDSHQHEAKIYQKWEASGAFSPDPDLAKSGAKPFVIMLPPPNITGSLHMGHALQDTIMDILIRWHRMQGETVLWLPGTDHAALPTNKILVDQLAQEGKSLPDIGREAFLKRADEWYQKIGSQILNQMKRLGASADWGRSRFTMDDAYSRAVQTAFVRYFEAGYIYRGERLVNWDPKTKTTVSDLEIDWKTEKTALYTFQYGPFQISTARPETKFGDKYVVMHPADARYQQYTHGQKIELEWINGPVTATVIKDDAVDQGFGTGVMTITPWHDLTDFEIAQRHTLAKEKIIGFDGKLLPIAGEFAGLTVAQARPKVVEKLQAKGLLVRIEENYEHNLALNDRGKGVIEPQIMRQWFLDMGKLKGETSKVAEEKLIKFFPKRWQEHFLTWMRNVRDWNINRQIWLGHRLPVWWKRDTHGTNHEESNFIVSIDKPEGDYEQDPDVLDTWFSSALWPFATLGWPENTADLATFYPTSVLVTGRDILYLWVARMIFSGLTLVGDIPFREVFIHPTVLTKDGQRMSKSLGTGVDPLDLIEKYGADATRFGLMYQMSYDTQAIKFDEEAIKSARNFANKIWNIARFLETMPIREEESKADKSIKSKLNKVTGQIEELLREYKMGEAARLLYQFAWKDFADTYIETLKLEGSANVAKATFQRLLGLLHPFMPHITEVLWQGEKMLIFGPWPKKTKELNEEAETWVYELQDVTSTTRAVRNLVGIPPGEEIELLQIESLRDSASLASLARAKLVNVEKKDMKRFPRLSGTGEPISIGSKSLNRENLDRARRKLEQQAEETKSFITQQRETLEKMQGRAPIEKIADKEKTITEAAKRLQEVTHSLDMLKS